MPLAAPLALALAWSECWQPWVHTLEQQPKLLGGWEQAGNGPGALSPVSLLPFGPRKRLLGRHICGSADGESWQIFPAGMSSQREEGAGALPGWVRS